MQQAIGDETVSILLIEESGLRIDLSTNCGGYAVHNELQAKAVDKVNHSYGENYRKKE